MSNRGSFWSGAVLSEVISVSDSFSRSHLGLVRSGSGYSPSEMYFQRSIWPGMVLTDIISVWYDDVKSRVIMVWDGLFRRLFDLSRFFQTWHRVWYCIFPFGNVASHVNLAWNCLHRRQFGLVRWCQIQRHIGLGRSCQTSIPSVTVFSKAESSYVQIQFSFKKTLSSDSRQYMCACQDFHAFILVSRLCNNKRRMPPLCSFLIWTYVLWDLSLGIFGLLRVCQLKHHLVWDGLVRHQFRLELSEQR